MPPEQLGSLTDREQRAVAVLRRVSPADVVLLAVAVLFGTIAHGLVSAYCNAPGGGPQAGTAASYCSTVSHGWSWGVFIATSVAIVVLLRLLGNRWRHRRQITLAVLVVALVANTVIVSSLPGYLGP
jgi:peptidoglycan/LPS O-acetylase OafA/YrhL